MRKFFIKLIGNKKQEKIEFEKIKRVLIPGGRIGDIVVKTPMFEELYRNNPNIKIDISVIKGAKSLIENCPYINEILEAEDYKLNNKVLKIWKNLKFSYKNRGKYDLYFDFTNNPRFFHILSLKLLNPKYLVGRYRFEKFGLRRDELTIFDRYVDVKNDEHAVTINNNFLKSLGMKAESDKYKLYLGTNEEKFKNYFNNEKINIVFNHRASAEHRTINKKDMCKILKNIVQLDKNIEIHILTMPNERESIEKIIAHLDVERVKLLVETKSIGEAAGILKYCDMLVSVDTGVVHLASVYNKPIVGIYPLDEKNYKLFEPKSDIKKITFGQEKGTIKNFNIEEVIKSVDEVLIEKEWYDKKS